MSNYEQPSEPTDIIRTGVSVHAPTSSPIRNSRDVRFRQRPGGGSDVSQVERETTDTLEQSPSEIDQALAGAYEHVVYGRPLSDLAARFRRNVDGDQPGPFTEDLSKRIAKGDDLSALTMEQKLRLFKLGETACSLLVDSQSQDTE